MPADAYNSAIFEASGDDTSASGPTVSVKFESGCAGCDNPADNPGGGSILSGCAGPERPSDSPGGGSMINALVVATGVGPRVGPEV